MENEKQKCDVIILAGTRQEGDALLDAHNVTTKALIPMHGKPLIYYVIKAIRQSGICGRMAVIGDAESLRSICGDDVIFIAPEDTIANSLTKGFAALSSDQYKPVLVTTADHPLLNADMLREFYNSMTDDDLGLAYVPLPEINAKYPEAQRTKMKLHVDGQAISFCNLFLFKTKGSQNILSFWQKLEPLRKKPLQMARLIGLRAIMRYITGCMTLRALFDLLERQTKIRCADVCLTQPEAAIDVDKQSDYDLVNRILEKEKT